MNTRNIMPKAAMVFCPNWINLPPIALAYIKGAVKDIELKCFDFNHDFMIQNIQDAGSSWQNPIQFRDFMGDHPNLSYFEEQCREVLSNYHDFLQSCVKRLEGYSIIGFSVNQHNIVFSTVLSKLIRSAYGAYTIIGGPTPNMDKHVFVDYFIKKEYFDLGFFGIAEDTINDLLLSISEGRDLSEIKGLAYLENNSKVYYTPKKTVNLSRYFPPDYGDFECSDYFKDRKDWIHIYAVVGCLGRCEFCTIREFYDGYFKKPVENIIKEIQYLRDRYGKDHFFLSDGMFLGNREDANTLFDYAIKNHIKLGIQIRMMGYWNDEDLVRKAAECVYYFQVGLESASSNVRKAMGKMINEDDTKQIFSYFYKYHLPLYVNIILGYPNETDQDFQLTLEFVEHFLTRPGILAIGTNVFFVPNSFPVEKYNIHYDENNHWKSEIVSIADRYHRVRKLIGTVEKLGLDRKMVYSSDNVEGLPLEMAQSAEGHFTKVQWISSPDSQVGWIDNIQIIDNKILRVNGWARNPVSGLLSDGIIITEEQNNPIFFSSYRAKRIDVAETYHDPQMVMSGWDIILYLSAIPKDIDELCLYSYDAGHNKAYQLKNRRVKLRCLNEN